MYAVPSFASSHITAERCNQLPLNHHVTKVHSKYIKRVIKNHNPVIRHNIPYIKDGFCVGNIIKNFRTCMYGVEILKEDMNVLPSRIQWIHTHTHEERTGTCVCFGFKSHIR